MIEEELPKGWAMANLGDLVEVLDKLRVPVNQREREKRPGTVPYYGAAGQVGTIDTALFNEPLVLLGEDGVQFFDPMKPKAYLIDGPSWVNNHAHVLRCTHVDRRYLKYYLDQVNYQGLATGTTRLKLTQAAMNRIPVAVPPGAEQRRIVEELERRLSHVGAAIRSLQLCTRRLAATRQAIARRLALPTLGGVDGELPALPPGWEWSTLGKVANVVGGVTKDAKRENDPGRVSVPYLRVANVQRGYLDLTDVTMIRVPTAKAKALLLEPGDILFTEGGDRDKLGRGWVWEGQIADCIHQNHVFRARLHDGRLHPKFVSWIGNTFGQKWFETAGKQTTNLASVNKSTLEAFPVPIPPPGVAAGIVDEIDRRLSLVDAATQSVATNLLRAEQLRRALLAAAFTGKLVPQEPSDEPASVLVERILAQRNDQALTARRGRGHNKEDVA